MVVTNLIVLKGGFVFLDYYLKVLNPERYFKNSEVRFQVSASCHTCPPSWGEFSLTSIINPFLDLISALHSLNT